MTPSTLGGASGISADSAGGSRTPQHRIWTQKGQMGERRVPRHPVSCQQPKTQPALQLGILLARVEVVPGEEMKGVRWGSTGGRSDR